MTERILPLELQLVSLAVLLVFSGWVVWLIRSQRLHLRESLAWIVSTAVAIVLLAYPPLLVWIATLLRFRAASNALFGAGLLYLAVNVLAVTISVSANTTHLRRLAQECALLRAEVAALRAAAGTSGAARGGAERRAAEQPAAPAAR